jgi:hypothetical protein
MKIKSRLIALAVSAGIPVTLVAQSPNDIYQGEYLLKISVPGVPWSITASSTYEPDGTLKEIDYLPSPQLPWNRKASRIRPLVPNGYRTVCD